MNRKLLTLTLSLLLGLAAVAAVALGIAAPQRTAQAQSTLLLEENFDYGDTPGNLTAVSGGNWVAHSATGTVPVQYIPVGLSMPKYGSSGIGGAATITSAGGSSAEDVNRSFENQTSGIVYLAALVNVTGASSTGDYFLHLKDAGTSNFRPRIWAKDDSGILRFGLGGISGTYATVNFNYNTTYLVVAKYNLTTGDAALYVLDAPVPVEPATPLVSANIGTQTVQAVAIRQGGTSRPAVIIDGIRVATTWEDAIGYTGEVSAIKNVTPDTDVPYHGTVTYTIVLVNSRAVSDTVLFTDNLPAEVDFGQWLEQPEGATVENDVITWSGTVTAGTAITFSFTAQHVGNYGDVVTNTAEFSGTEDAGTAQAVFAVEKLTADVTFVYHDLEDAVLSGETVCLRGDFNGWNCVQMNADPDNTVFSLTVSGLEVGQVYQYKYYVNSTDLGENSRWDMLNTNNRVLTVTSDVNTVHDYRNVVVGWANLQWPYTLQTDYNKPTDPVYGRVYIPNVTNPSGAGRGIKAEVGYGTGPDPATWTWFPMTYNVDDWNNDEFVGVMTPTAGGVFSYATRFDGNWGPGNPNAGWTYGDTNGSPPFDLDKTGVLTVVLYDVALTKTAPTEPVVVRNGEGALVTCTLTIENRSTITPVAPITLTEVLPEGFIYVSDDSGVSPTGSGTADDPLVWEFGTPLLPGESLSFNLVVSATDALTATGRYTNTAWVEVAGGDWISENDTAQAGVTVYRVIPIAQARGLPTGTLVAIEGTVTAEPGIFKDSGQSRKLYMQDNTGGVLVYLSTGLNPVSRHNRVRVVGTMAEYRAETEIIPLSATDVVDLGPDTPVEPLPIATGAVDESVEGQLVRVAGYIVEKPNAYTLRVNDGSGSVDIYRYYNLGQTSDPNYIDFTPYVVGDYVVVTGTTRGYDYSGTIRREVLPRGPADVKELYPTTFVYHDLEDVVHSGEAVYLAGSFNGWDTTATPMNANDDFSVFSVTVTLENTGTYEYKYVVYTDTERSGPVQWDWLQRSGSEGNRSVNITAANQVVNDYRNVTVGWAILQWPPAITITLGQSTGDIYGRVYIANVTNPSGEGRGIKAEVGYGTGPDPATWTWFPMTYNTDDWNNDEFKGAFTPSAAGVYSYAVRFDGNWGAGNPNSGWTYGDLDGVHPTEPFELDQCGVLTVLTPGLNVFKSVTPDADVPLGGVVTYTVVLSNSGAGDAIGVVLTDVLPSEVTFGGWVQQSGAVYENGVITWTGTVAGNAEVTLVFTATLGSDPSLYNRTVANTASFVSGNAGSGSATATFATERRYWVYLPLVMRNR